PFDERHPPRVPVRPSGHRASLSSAGAARFARARRSRRRRAFVRHAETRRRRARDRGTRLMRAVFWIILLLAIVGTPIFALMGGASELFWLTHAAPVYRHLRYIA